jgi:N-acetylmuramic acid 6-phosphate etherase
MVNMRPSNAKLVDRAERIIAAAVGCDAEAAARLLLESDRDVKLAIVMGKMGLGRAEAAKRLASAGGILADALAKENF